ncbi:MULTISPECIES: leucyl aminopeptidase family protein [unclassified Crossiella]|uniref:leucyl aminopeptidase family protein n=1 Tax=unclassified Crossiella TaxID=2620835 RepID=UPI001FFE4025|nr:MULTISPECIES: leucyl aminopeptidase family protein [unclassified Crossiella]MCK2237215.1 leucyl aminopeptidase family protein [Crossiella sp. S99.2]MCK2250870.1 leucyl aminopeptidase family protein [Crossiella sp. S99.1]
MPSVVPTAPSPVPEVTIARKRRKAAPPVVLAHKGEQGPEVGTGADSLDLPAGWSEALALTGSAGETRVVPQSGSGLAWVLGLGAGTVKDWRSAGAALVRAADARAAADEENGRTPAKQLQVLLPSDADAERVAAFTTGVALGGYKFKVTGGKQAPVTKAVELVLPEGVAAPELADAVAGAAQRARVTSIARDLANTPSDVKDPAWLASTAARLGKGVDGLTVTVRDEKWLAKQGFGGVLAVGGGSSRPPRFVELTWRPEQVSADSPHLVLVGKGITFDTGGISIKPAAGMHLMRTDMSGGAAVIAALLGIAALKLPVKVTGLVPCAENHVSGTAYRPGDVVRHYGGTTTEVTNTDAEGRMVLADALAYGVVTHQPDLLVDVATLTGAMKVSLGTRTGGLFATDEDLAERITGAGARVGEAWWRMPLLAAHEDDVRSELADLRQCPPGPGGVTAALFLREFTAGLPWAHLDIAGPARAEKAYDEVTGGATGFAARTLVELVAGYA